MNTKTTKPPKVGLISFKGILFNYADLSEPQIKQLTSKLTFTQKMNQGKRVVYKKTYFYKIYELPSKKLFAIARAALIHNYKNIQAIPFILKNKVLDGTDITPERFLRDNTSGVNLEVPQQVVHDYLINQINQELETHGVAGVIFVMDAGLGKSFVAAKLIETIKKKTLLVVMNNNQMQQWCTDVFAKYYPNLKIGTIKAKKTDGDVVVVIINSLKKLTNEYLKTFGLIIYDEIPEFMGDDRRQAFWNTGVKRALGLTATPDERTDGMDIYYKQLVGPLIIANDVEGFGIDPIIWQGNVTAIQYSGPPKYTKHLTSCTGDMNCSLMNQQLSEDPYRNQLVINDIVDLYKQGKFIYVFAQKRVHLTNLHRILISLGIQCEQDDAPDDDDLDNPEDTSGENPLPDPDTTIKKVKAQTLMGGSNDEEIVKAKLRSRIILTTFGYGSVGMSIVKMDAILFYTPRRNKMRQILGRILRRGGDPTQVRAIKDYIDVNTNLKSQYTDRKKVYNEKGFPITKIQISYKKVQLKDFKLTDSNDRESIEASLQDDQDDQ
jgi:hypothetical protein